MRLCHASPADSEWLHGVLETISRGFGCPVRREPDGALIVRPPAASAVAPDRRRQVTGALSAQTGEYGRAG